MGKRGSTENFAGLAKCAVSLDHYMPWCLEVLGRSKIRCLMERGRLEVYFIDKGQY